MRTAIFILSHGRAGNVRSYKTVADAGYTGEVYIVVDDEDDQLGDYRMLYGEACAVFSKSDILGETDTMDCGDETRSVVFARNECYKIANRIGVDYFIEMDDDIESLSIRYEHGGKLKSCKLKHMDALVSSMAEFMDSADIASLGVVSSGALMGGANGTFSKGIQRNINQMFMLSAKAPIKFVGVLNEDMNTLLLESKIGKLCLEITNVAKESPKRGTNPGGLSELYDQSGEYVRAYYSVVAAPACCTVQVAGESASLKCDRDRAFPKILSERMKK